MKKILLFIWFGDEKPPYIEWTLDNFRKMNPGWEIRFIEYSNEQLKNYDKLGDPHLERVMKNRISKGEVGFDYHVLDSYKHEYLCAHKDEFIIYCDLDCFPIAPFDDFIYTGFPNANQDWYKFLSDNKLEMRYLGSMGSMSDKTIFGRDIWCISNNASLTVDRFLQIHKDANLGNAILFEGMFINKEDIPKYRDRHRQFQEMKLQLGDAFCSPRFTPIEHYPNREWMKLNQEINAENKKYINYWTEQYNIGDLFANVVLDYIYDKGKLDKLNDRKTMLFIGSDIPYCCNGNTLCCGLGWQWEDCEPKLDSTKVNASNFCYTRGKISKQRVIDSGVQIPSDLPIGDTGLLVGLLCPTTVEKTTDIGIITHWQSFDKHDEFLKVAKNMFPDKTIKIACMGDNNMSIDDMLHFICSSRVVLSGSLHALIFSHALGVPALFFSNQPGYKYRDYYSVYDRIDYQDLYKWTTLSDAIKNANNQEFLASVNPTREEVEQVQKNIVKALPYRECFTEVGRKLLDWAMTGEETR